MMFSLRFDILRAVLMHWSRIFYTCFMTFHLFPEWHQGAGIFHHLSVGYPLRLLCVTVSGGKCASVHHATRRWDLFPQIYFVFD